MVVVTWDLDLSKKWLTQNFFLWVFHVKMNFLLAIWHKSPFYPKENHVISICEITMLAIMCYIDYCKGLISPEVIWSGLVDREEEEDFYLQV